MWQVQGDSKGWPQSERAGRYEGRTKEKSGLCDRDQGVFRECINPYYSAPSKNKIFRNFF